VKYHVRFGARTVEVEAAGGRVSVEGEPFEAHMASVPGIPLHHLLLAGESWTIAAQLLSGPGEIGGSRWALGVAGERIEVEVVDDRTRQIQSLVRRAGVRGGERRCRGLWCGWSERGRAVSAGAGLSS
jgi:hypothetical protein